ncbi:TetR/AcrR family transcriptional regulator [Natroniella sulfidigena]|uniref:TetR/AcrR family transcriptional regulator n=1 Tax=Natroniella sulfidigena TaxID=723921 RepID=UPI00200B9B4A|nr:TetR/AcrR family transcriptional regulator [Natroniella sulfidigena]MCK8817902.1 TetR/AcrR family transcriptional regulator [Natroniella sulfidigena]
MPSDTFFNLPQDKQERVLDAAIKEFSRFSYHKTSINRIVEEAEIAKGSFYQYFTGKKDLFKYIIELITEKKMVYLSHIMSEKESLDFFELLREIYLAGFRFGKDNPRLQLIAFRIINLDNQLKKEIMNRSKDRSEQFFIQLLKDGVNKGEIDSEIDLEFTAYLITKLNMSVLEDYFVKRLQLDSEEDILNLEENEMMVFVDKLLSLIKHGIKSD